MKKLFICTAALLTLTLQLHGQGNVTFGNNTSSAITNGLTGTRVAAGTAFRVALYSAPDGTTDESQFTQVGASVPIAPAAGLFTGGERIATNVPPYGYGMFQVRSWETAYGMSYEEAVAAPPASGRGALVGKSTLLRVRAGIPGTAPGQSLIQAGLQSFTLQSVAGSSLAIGDRVVAEGTNGTVEVQFTVTLAVASAQTVSVDYATADASAEAGSDYVATNGTLVFAPGEINKTISVFLTPDVAPEADEHFFVNLSNPVNAPIVDASAYCLITEVRIDGISVDVGVRFNTLAGHRYVLEKSDDLTTWSTVAGAEDVLGTGTLIRVYDEGGGSQPNRLYRARLLE